MKKSTFILAALALGTASLPAQTPAPAAAAPAAAPAPAPAADASGASWVLTPSFASQYMFRGVRLGGPAFEPSLEYDNGNLAIGVWNNTPIKDKVPGQSDPEFDFYGSYSFDLIKDTAQLVPGYTIYTYPNANTGNGFYKATFEPNLALNYTLGPVKFTPKLYYDFVLKGPTAELTAAFAIPLKDAGTELDFTAVAGTYKWTSAAADSTPDVKNWGDYYLVGVAAPFQINKESKLTIGWAYTDGTGNYLKQGTAGKVANSGAVSRGVFTISYAYTF
jgi:uncharacterized protein (TIGR02001 family)